MFRVSRHSVDCCCFEFMEQDMKKGRHVGEDEDEDENEHEDADKDVYDDEDEDGEG